MLMLNLTGRSYDDKLIKFLRVDEHLVDIGDDLVDYEVKATVLTVLEFMIRLFCLLSLPPSCTPVKYHASLMHYCIAYQQDPVEFHRSHGWHCIFSSHSACAH